jgi:pyruvate/2-oxoglutarate dehydrogenase complex dihydrolipoamide acyltransferase (E2) component
MTEPTPVFIPQENVNDESVTLIAWCVMNGEQVQEGQDLAEVEGSKAVFTIPAPVAGTVQYSLEVGQEIAVGEVLCMVSSAASVALASTAADGVPAPTSGSQPAPDQPTVLKDQLPEHAPDAPSGAPRFSRQAAALLQQHRLDTQHFVGYGLVRTADVLAVLGHNGVSTPPVLSPPVMEPRSPQTVAAPTPAAGVPFRREILSRSKQTEIRYLASGYHNTLPSVVTIAVPTRGLRAAAAQYAHASGSITAIMLFEVGRLLRHYPLFNAFYAHGAAHLYEAVNIGFALDAGHGLKVPVIRQADTKSLPEIASEMQAMLRRYLDHTLRVEDLAAGTFTITDLSNEGVLTFHPLINQGQAAILGIGSEYSSGIGPVGGFFTLILAFDHQLTEGRQAAQFLHELARRLQAYEAVMQAESSEAHELHCARCLTSLSRLRQLNQGQRGAHFLVQTIQPDGTQAYCCSLCMQGW